jgi:dihydroorotate dehydrogenase electron transfer subunit
MKQLKVKISENVKIASGVYRMRILSSYLAGSGKPGQFVEVRCSDRNDPLLRRPFSCHRIFTLGIELLYKVVGNGTEALACKKRGDTLDIIGPLGNGFDIKRTSNNERRTTILVAGGIGVAPLLALAEQLAHSAKGKIYVLIGAKTKSHLLCEKEFKKVGAEISTATEDGSKGNKGFVTGLLTDFLRNTNDERRTTIYACGPNAMLKEVARLAAINKVPCQVSLEERMACGVGVCLGCPVKVKTHNAQRITHYEYKMVCRDGPVFDASQIAW